MTLRLLILIGLLLVASPVWGAPRAELWPRFEAADASSNHSIDHKSWGQLLEQHVHLGADGISRVDYARFSAADRTLLEQYIDGLEAIAVTRVRRPEQLAYWINLYNAVTVRTVLAHYPVPSIRDIDISPGMFAQGPWGAELMLVEGQKVSLDDIEHRILRPIWRDPRIHYALNCASLGCPNLQPEPFEADRIERQLDAAALQYINSKRAMWINGDELHVSSIYRWFADDFGGTEASIIHHLMAYAEPGLAMRLQSFTEIAGNAYDWTLNDAGR